MKLTISQALQKGVEAHRGGKPQEAERFYRAILGSQPSHPDANHNLGVLTASFSKFEEALPLFKTALEANPKKEQFWLSYIDALIKTEKLEEAKKVIVDANQAGIATERLHVFEEQLQSELSPSSDLPQQKFGNQLRSHQDELSAAIELREVGKYKEAQELLSNLIKHDSKNPEALSLLSQVFLLDKKDAEAERALRAAASINPELRSVYRNQARLLLKQSKKVEALEKAQLGCKQSPEDLESLLVLAACLGENKRDLEALPIIEKILKAKSDYAEAYANRAIIKLRAKDTAGAIEDAEMTVSLKPHLTHIWQLLGSLYYQGGNLGEAIVALRSAHKNEPENAAFMIQLGEFLRQDNKVSEAITILEKATELAPKNAKAWTNLGVAFQQGKRLDDAKMAYEKALALNPKSATILSNLGAMAMGAEEWESALRYFESALEIDSNLAEAHSNSGITLQALGRFDEAEISYKQAIALQPDYAEAHGNLGINFYSNGNIDAAIESLQKARDIDPKSGHGGIVLSVLRARKARGIAEGSSDNNERDKDARLISDPLFLKRVVEPELVLALLEMQSRDMDEASNTPVFGNGRCSLDYNIFEASFPIIKMVEKDLITLMESAFKSKIYLADSFFNIYAAGAGISPHTHLNQLDKNKYLKLAKQKFSLVYYISVGDQDCTEPGFFKLYDPVEEILPCEGMILVIPAGRRHSAVYNGKKDRIIIGINFYTL